MIESITIRLVTGREIELTQEEARLLMGELRDIFGQREYLPVYLPVSMPFVQTPDWIRPPFKATSSDSAASSGVEIRWASTLP